MNKVLQNIQKETGIKQGQYDNEQNRLYNMCQMSILMLNNLWKQIEDAEMQNKQFVEDWVDNIDKIIKRYDQ